MTEEEKESEATQEEASPNAEGDSTGAENQDAAETSPNNDINWSRARETMSEQSQQLKVLRAELEALREQKESVPQQQQKAQDYFDGRDEDDILTVADFKKASDSQEQSYKKQIAELKAKASYSDFDDVVNTYGKSLPDSIKEAILFAPDPYKAAYEACKLVSKTDSNSKTQDNVKKVEENLSKPGNASAVGGSGVLGKSGYYAGLSSEEIRAMTI